MKRPILFTAITFLFLTSLTLFAYNIVEVFIPKGLELIEGKSLLTTETSLIPTNSETPVDVSGMFNERGFYKSSSVSYYENEIINDYNGNLMYSFPLFSEKGPGDIYLDMSLNYNGAVNYQVVAGHLGWAEYQLPRYNITAPGWIFSINGMAVQMMNFETNFFTKPEPVTETTVRNNKIRLLASGYHLTDELRLADNSATDKDQIMLMRGDGSVLTLKRISNTSCSSNSPDCYIGEYYSENKGDYTRAKVEFIEHGTPLPPPMYRNRRVSLMKGDGLTYIYDEHKIRYHDFPYQGSTNEIYLPQVFLLKQIKDRFGHTLNLQYQGYYGGLENGRYLFNNIQGNWDNAPKPHIAFTYGSIGNSGLIKVDNINKGTYKVYCDGINYDNEYCHRPNPYELRNPAGDKITFTYERYHRLAYDVKNPYYNNGSSDPYISLSFDQTINYDALKRLKTVINYNGGKREYTYKHESEGYLSVDMDPGWDYKIQSASLNHYFGQGRDMFFNNMLSEVEVYDGGELIRSETIEYGYQDVNDDRQTNPVDENDTYNTTRSTFAPQSELNYNTPTILRTKKAYRNFKLYEIPENPSNPDFPGHTKMIQEIFYTTDENYPYKKIEYEFMAEEGSNSLFHGSFLDTNITETIKNVERVRSFRYTHSQYPQSPWGNTNNNPITEKTEYDPFRIKTVYSYLIFYDPENIHYLNGDYNPYQGGSNVNDTTAFYIINQLETLERFYQEVNTIYKETYEYHDSNNDDGYIGQLKEKRILNSNNYNDYKRIQYKYFIKDTLGINLYPNVGTKPSTEGNLKEIIDPKGNSTKFYYHPVVSDYSGGTLTQPYIIYKKVFNNGTVEKDSAKWEDIRLPTITENIPNANVSLYSFREYNKAGNVTFDLNQYHYLTEFDYDGLDRIRTATLPYDFNTSSYRDSLVIDTTYAPIEYTLGTDGWGFFTKGSIDPFRFIENDHNRDSLIQGPFTLNIFHEEGGTAGPNDTNHLPIMRFNVNDTISINLSEIDSAKFEYFPTYLWTIYNNDTSTNNLCLEIQAYKHVEKKDTPYELILQQGSGYGKFELPGLIEKVNDCVWLRDNYYNYYQSIDVTEMLRDHLIEGREKLAGFSFNIRTWEIPMNPREEYDMYLSWCIKPTYPQGILPRVWINDYSPRIRISGTYMRIDTTIIPIYPKATLRYVYDDQHNKTRIYSALDNNTDKETEHIFDGFYRVKQSNLITTNEGDFDSALVMYNYLDLQAKTIDGRGNASKFSYDELLNLKQTENADNSSTLVDNIYLDGMYYYFGHVAGLVNKQKFTDEEGNNFEKYFDAVGKLIRETKYVFGIPTEDEGYETIPIYTDYRYDSLYRVTHVKTPEGKIISYAYDGYGRQKQRTTPDAGTAKYMYDKNNNLRFSQDENQDLSSSDLITFRGYDDINRLLYIGEASLSGDTPGGWSSLDPDITNSFENYTYHSDYFLTVYVYDTLSTAIGGEFSPPDDYYSTINYTMGNLVATAYRTRGTDPWNYKYYRYDVRGRVIRMWHVIYGLDTKIIDYTYNSQNQVTYLSYQLGSEEEFKKFRYIYDKAGRLEDVYVYLPYPTEDYYNFTSYEYNQNSQVSRHSFNDDNIHTDYNYNNRNWIVSGLNNSVFRYAILEYYKNGNVKKQSLVGNYNGNFSTMGDITITYTYDPSNRLLKADAGATTSTFDLENTYDYDGNIKTLMRYGSNNNLLDNFNYEYITGTNKLRKVSGTIDQYTYDYNGNMIDDIFQDNHELKYDHRNLLTEISRLISENETELTRYYYDETGNRVRKLVLRNWSGGGGIPDPPNWGDIGSLPIYEPEGEGGDGWSIYKNEFYVRGVGGYTIAEYDWETLKQWNVYGTDNVGKITKDGEEENKYYYLKDHLGSIRAVIDEDNNCVSAQDYDMWGYLLENRTFDIEREKYKFTGKERDEESSYDYFGARYYMSRIGRWSSVDPFFENCYDFSLYNYVLDNPLKLIDPNGKFVIPKHLIKHYKKNYPRLYKLIRYDIEKIADKEKVIKSLVKHTGLSREEIKKYLKWGEGPQILVEQLGSDDRDMIRLGTQDILSNAIYLDIDLINDFESAESDQAFKYEFFLKYALIPHEGVHIGSYWGKDNIDFSQIDDPYSLADSYEKDVFNTVVASVNTAVKILNDYYKERYGISNKYSYVKKGE